MDMTNPFNKLRRMLLTSTLLAIAQLISTKTVPGQAASARGDLAPTPSCGAADESTPQQTAGPFFKPQSPERKSLIEAGMAGNRIVIEGVIRTTRCKPIERALVDFWQADASGVYDNQGYRLRGHQYSDATGRYRLETVVPGLYPGRTRHIHIRVQAPNGPLLTTQLYFPGEAENRRDGIFNAKLVMSVRATANTTVANFDFVLTAG